MGDSPCGSVLELVVDIDVSRDIFEGRRDTLWKFKECIPVDETKIVSLDEGGTPFCKCGKLDSDFATKFNQWAAQFLPMCQSETL